MIKKVIPEYSNKQMEKLIDEYIHSERDRKILKRRLIDGIVYDALSREFDLSVKGIRDLIDRSEKVLFKHL